MTGRSQPRTNQIVITVIIFFSLNWPCHSLCPGDPVAIWISHVWKPSAGSSFTQSLWPDTKPVHTSTLCMGSGSCLRDSPGHIITNQISAGLLSAQHASRSSAVLIFNSSSADCGAQVQHSLFIVCVFQTECRVWRHISAQQNRGWDSDGQRQSESSEVWWKGKESTYWEKRMKTDAMLKCLAKKGY